MHSILVLYSYVFFAPQNGAHHTAAVTFFAKVVFCNCFYRMRWRVVGDQGSRRNCLCCVENGTWFKVRQRPVFWPSGRVPSTLRARQCSPTTAPSGAGSGVPFFFGVRGVSCCCTPEGPPTRREVLVSSDGVVRNIVVLSNKAS